MNLDHSSLVWFSKSYGLFYLLALSAAVLVYAYWPSNKKTFEQAGRAILEDDDDRPAKTSEKG
ncbi:cbb3-type cytochrome c oxidase subunit 3 [[Pseudomonas] carboxydohydrogena]|uniref:Cbb3-type cytochrome c oxidase subunit 3 n=1 Tax=Afipia carboxydohydrogena TaxID=290 RepID=A0ABY8BQ40_AFICR|nr:cbb3-type cytochrome c oxidase subunit 3 [[Pseudomonas] carboxydohydrogena]WEF51044.1 cbb3-type cytochrome c oxidase subunit 3 [[Pseudomonas] carboxydohydrogena]